MRVPSRFRNRPIAKRIPICDELGRGVFHARISHPAPLSVLITSLTGGGTSSGSGRGKCPAKIWTLGAVGHSSTTRTRGWSNGVRGRAQEAPLSNPDGLLKAMANWSLTSLQLKLIKIGTRVVRHARTITFQLAEVAVTGAMVRAILNAIHRLRAPPSCA